MSPELKIHMANHLLVNFNRIKTELLSSPCPKFAPPTASIPENPPYFWCLLFSHRPFSHRSISKSGWLYLQTLSKTQPLLISTLILPRSKPLSLLLHWAFSPNGTFGTFSPAGTFSPNGQSNPVKTKYVHHFFVQNSPFTSHDTQNKT